MNASNTRVSLLLVIALLLAAPAAAASDLDSLERELRRVVAHWLSEQPPGSNPELDLELPAERLLDLGLVFDGAFSERTDREGLEVILVTPGGAAEAMGIALGDRLQSLNDLDLRHLGVDAQGRARAGEALLLALYRTPAGEPLRLEVARGGQPLQIEGNARSRELPAMRVQIGGGRQVAQVVTNPSLGGCGELRMNLVTPRSRQIYPLVVRALNGDHRVGNQRGANTVRVPAGTYEVQVTELINDDRFTHRQHLRSFTQSFQLTIEADQIYDLGAEFFPGVPLRRGSSDYWRPVVWQQADQPCDSANFVPRDLRN